MFARISLYAIFINILLITCESKPKYLVLKISNFSNVSRIDTIENYKERGLYLLGVTRNNALDKFMYEYIIVKENDKNRIIYEINKKQYSGRVSKDFISLVNTYATTNWGWFNIQKGKILNELPGIDAILDSLKQVYPEKYLIRETNGYIAVYLEGKVIKSINYGNLISINKEQNLDSLNYGVYILEKGYLKLISNDGNTLFKQNNGIYFVPSPGYGVVQKFNKKKIYDIIDSIFFKGIYPSEIHIQE